MNILLNANEAIRLIKDGGCEVARCVTLREPIGWAGIAASRTKLSELATFAEHEQGSRLFWRDDIEDWLRETTPAAPAQRDLLG